MSALSTLTTTQTVFVSFLIINQAVVPFAPVLSTGGGTLPISYSILPSISTGLNFSTTTGFISGTPTVLSDIVNYVITITDSGTGTNLQSLSFPFDSAVVKPLSNFVEIKNKTITATVPTAPFTPISINGGYGEKTWNISPVLDQSGYYSDLFGFFGQTLPSEGLKFNSLTGAMSGTARSGNTSTIYTVTVTDSTPYQTTGTFTLTILPFKELSVPQPWESTGTIGTLALGEISELYVKAQFSTSTVYENYSLGKDITGEESLPPGLTLNRDGTISGRATNDYFNEELAVWFFTVVVTDTNDNVLLEGRFSIRIDQSNTTEYTEIYCKPFLTQTKRIAFTNFIRNEQIFIPNLLYRLFDSNFGKQEELKLVIDFGVKRELLSDYAEFILTNFYRRRLLLGSLKTAVAKNADGSVRHEIIYVDVIDKHVNSNKISIPTEIEFNGITYYPPSIPNMRSTLASNTELTSIRNPSFTNTVQAGESTKSGYIAYIPLCFTLPGKSATIIRKINESGFKFNTIDFEIDRLIVQNALGESSAKYLLLHSNSRLA
jgi:hypothetical protein